jgi:N-carbamoyl-L-amino-acid hydrolase
MAERKNALLAASELVLAVDRIVKAQPGRQVGTVGQLAVKPGARNVIPGEVSLSIELRDLDEPKLDKIWEEIRAEGDRIMARQGTTWSFVPRPPNIAAMSTADARVVTVSAKQLGADGQSRCQRRRADARTLADRSDGDDLRAVRGRHQPLTSRVHLSRGRHQRRERVLLQSVLRLDGVTAG